MSTERGGMGGSGLRLHGAESGAAMMEDWTRWLTEEEREKERRWRHGVGPVQRDINPLLRSLAASRALVAKKDKALKRLTIYEGYSNDSGNGRMCSFCSGYVNYENGDIGHYADCPIPAAKMALALTEEEMR